MNELIACTLVVVEAEAKGNGLEMLERRIINTGSANGNLGGSRVAEVESAFLSELVVVYGLCLGPLGGRS
jgi:hypothetical protein